MKRALLVLLFLAFPLRAETIAFVNGRWFDGRGFRARTFYSVDGTLLAARPKAVDRTVDLGGKFVVPPFGDAHHHGIDSIEGLDAKIAAFLKAGVFYVKNPNVIPDLLTPEVRAKLNRDDSIDVVFANGGLTSAGGHPVGLHTWLARRGVFKGLTPQDMNDHAYFTIDSEEELAAKWPRILAGKPDFIKTFMLYADGNPPMKNMKGLSPAMLRAVVARAHAAGLRVSTHVETAADFRHAAEAGVDEINHLPIPQGASLAAFAIDRETARLAAKKHITVVATASAHERLGAMHLKAEETEPHRANQAANLKLLASAGVRIAIGSDGISGETPFVTGLDEVMFVKRHMAFDNLALLKMWSETTAQTIFPSRKIGRLADGFEASFLVLDGDPLQDFENVKRISMRVKRGREL